MIERGKYYIAKKGDRVCWFTPVFPHNGAWVCRAFDYHSHSDCQVIREKDWTTIEQIPKEPFMDKAIFSLTEMARVFEIDVREVKQ